ncbi:MAG TPA: flagellar export chaperone FliS [Planctomycetota bacterium]|nr:flagellar export chaperone FliS [Planctomycetota bacterium]
MSYAQAAATYQRNAILTASPEKLVKLLYDGAIKNLEKSRVGLADARTSHSQEVGNSLGRAIGILGELRASLDHAAGGQVARDLDRLYEFSLDQLSQANVTRKPEGVSAALSVVRTLKEGWDGIVPG